MTETRVLTQPLRIHVGWRCNLSPEWPCEQLYAGTGYFARPNGAIYTAPAGVEVWDPVGRLGPEHTDVKYARSGETNVAHVWLDVPLYFREGDQFYVAKTDRNQAIESGTVTAASVIVEVVGSEMAYKRRFRREFPEAWFPPDGGGNCADPEVWKEWRWPDGQRFYDRYPNAKMCTGWYFER